jgi:hypothetical protein
MVNYSRKQIPIINILIHVQQSINENHIGGIMVSMFSLSAVDHNLFQIQKENIS